MLRDLSKHEVSMVSGGNVNSGYEGCSCVSASIKGEEQWAVIQLERFEVEWLVHCKGHADVGAEATAS